MLALVFAAGDLLFAQPGPLLSLPVFLFGDFGQVVGGQLEFFDAQPVVGVGDHDVHRAAEPGDGLPGFLQPRDGGVQGVGLHRADRVVRLVVVGAQHQLGELADHLAASSGRAVDRPVRRSPHRGPGLDRVLDPRLHPGQLGLVGDGVIERMPVLVDPGLLQDRGLAGLDQLLGQLRLLGPQSRDLRDQLLQPGHLGAERITPLLQLLDLGLHGSNLGALRVQGGQFGPQRDDGAGQFGVFLPQPGDLIPQPGHLGRELVSLGDAYAVQGLPEPVDLGVQITLALRAPFMAAGAGLHRGRRGAGGPGGLSVRRDRRRNRPGLDMGCPLGAIPPPQQRGILMIWIPACRYRTHCHSRTPSVMSTQNQLNPGPRETSDLVAQRGQLDGQEATTASPAAWTRYRLDPSLDMPLLCSSLRR